MKKLNLSLIAISILSVSSLTLNDVYAQGGGRIYSKNHRVYTTCPECEGLVKDYDDADKARSALEQELADIKKSIAVDEQFIQSDNAKISQTEAMPPSPKKSEQLNTLERVKNNDMKDLKKHQSDADTISNRIHQLNEEILEILWDIEDCEDYFCGGSAYYQSYRGEYAALYNHLLSAQLGVMVGNLTSSQSAHVDVVSDLPSNYFSNSNTTNQANLGLQLKLLLGDQKTIRPTFSIHGEKIINTSNTLLDEILSSISTIPTSVTLHNDWIVRTLIGAESPVFYNRFTMGFAAGPAFIGQTLNTHISGDSFSRSKTSTIPSLAANITYYACPNCLFGLPLTISGQVIADEFPGVTVKGSNAIGTPIESSSIQKWQFTENLVFSVDLSKSF